MPERRHLATTNTSTSSSSTVRPSTGVRRNIFQQHLRTSRPASRSISTSTSADTLRLDSRDDGDADMDEEQDIVKRDHNGEFQIGDTPTMSSEEADGESAVERGEDEKERQRLVDAVKDHHRDRNRAPSEPAELLHDVRAVLRNKVAALAEDNWMYEAEDETMSR